MLLCGANVGAEKEKKYRSEKLEITTHPVECRFSAGESN